MTHRNTRRGRRLAGMALVAALGAVALVATSFAGTSTPAVALGNVPMTPALKRDLASLPGIAPYGAFVHFRGGEVGEQRDLVQAHGLTVTETFPSVDVVYAVGTVAEVRGLTREPAVTYLEDNRKLQYFGDTAVWATRARATQEDVSGGPYRDAVGRVLNGAGVGVAVVDSGILATHPDLTNRVSKNFKIVCSTPLLIDTETEQCFGPMEFVDVGNLGSSDTSSGHGTHVSGIIAGDGTASTGAYPSAAPNVRGTFTGVAPGATLYGFGTGEAIAVLYSVEAFQYILDHYDDFNPRIRVVNNSWGDTAGTPYDPNSVQSKLMDRLVEKGVTMVFAAGNSGGTGQADRTSSTCKSPTRGVICVANYDDGAGATSGTGSRNGTLNGDGTDLSAHSSRGVKGSPATYPDVSAPGTFYTAACLRVQPVCATGIINETRWGGVYASISGTSMATPHTVGVAALMLQARPDLTPAEIEDILQDTAYRYAFNTTQGANAAILPGPYEADPQNPGGTISYDKGAGLIDVPAALQALGVAHDGGATQQGQALLHVDQPADGAEFDGSAPIAVSGTAADGVVQPAPPAERVLLSGDGGDLANGPGAADIESLSVQETAAGASPGGLTYRLALRDAADFAGAIPSVSYRVTQNVDGTACQTNVSATPLGVTPTAGTCAATSASRTGNVVSFFVPYANLGNPTPGSPAYTVFASAFVNVIVDVAPSAGGPAAADLNERPMFARPYTVARPEATQVPAAAVTVAVDGGAERAATLTGSSPDYDWTASAIDPAPLANGTHTLTARLYLNGVVRATDTSSFAVQRPVPRTYAVAITSPADGATVPRAVVAVQGTSDTDDTSGAQAVMLEVSRTGYSSGQLPATGTSPWTRDVDFGALAAGTYTLTARLLVGGVERAASTATVTVPQAATQEVSCSPRKLGFWRDQYAGKKLKFLPTELSQLSTRAAALSAGYFGDGAAVVSALGADTTPEQRAARQYAALLLNLAAGDLSRGMTYAAGLSGSERLDAKAYDTARVGSTVDAAAAWIRAQLPNGDLGNAAELADAINTGHKLGC